MDRKGFTLLELLIVISILGILATATVLLLNPVEYLRQGRDTKRVADIGMLNIGLAEVYSSGVSLGTASTTVYVSLVDTVDTCANLGLPPVPTGYRYHCVTSAADVKKIDGNGWVPVNFAAMQGGSSVTLLPTDPINSATYFYTYVSGGSFAVSALLESNKYLKQSALADGGTNPGKIEMGSNLKLLAGTDGLEGYWPLDEGSGTQVADVSGNGNTGTGATIGWTSAGCILGKCITAAPGNTTISIPSNASLMLGATFTLVNWVKINTAIPASSWPVSFGAGNTHVGYGFRSQSNGTNWMFEYGNDYPACAGVWTNNGGLNLGTGAWHFLSVTYDGTSIKVYLDGVLKTNSGFNKGFCPTFPMYIGNISTAPGTFMVDEPRIYSRALSASEITAMYAAAK